MPLTEAPVVGKDCKLYLNAATHATPTWTEVKSAINVSANLGKGEAVHAQLFLGNLNLNLKFAATADFHLANTRGLQQPVFDLFHHFSQYSLRGVAIEIQPQHLMNVGV